jgi:hypothetical protein
LVAVKPSPLAVILTVAEPTVAADEANSVNVEEPFSPLSVTGLLLHEAVTPLGRPLTVRLTGPLYVPLPATETTTDPVFPCIADKAVEAAEIASAGGVSVTVMGKFTLAM